MEKILVAEQIGKWFGFMQYLQNWGYTAETIRQETAESLLSGIYANLEANTETRGLSEQLVSACYEDGDELRLNAYGEIDENGDLYEVHEITLADCQRIIDNGKC